MLSLPTTTAAMTEASPRAGRMRTARPLLASTILGCLLASAAGLLPAPAAAQAQAQPQQLDRLFYTPEQRREMDRRRAAPPQAPVVATPAAPVVDTVKINGRVARSSGKSTTWVNGVPQNDAYAGSDAGRVVVRTPGDTGSTSVKVGETLDRLKGEKRDGLDGGKIVVRSGPGTTGGNAARTR